MNNPLFNDHPLEMGAKGNEEKILKRITANERYQKMFTNLGLDISWTNIKTAISSFMATIQSANSPYDKFKSGDTTALDGSQKKGMELFFSSRLKCASCHGGFNFSTPAITGESGDTIFFFNTGMYDIDGKGSYPVYDQGLYQLTKNKADMGKFRVPTLRNLVFTAPYFHDGTAAAIGDVIDSYINGGGKIKEGIYKGDGKMNPYKHPLVNGFNISETDKINLVSFLFSLGDSSLITDPAYQNPFTEDETKK